MQDDVNISRFTHAPSHLTHVTYGGLKGSSSEKRGTTLVEGCDSTAALSMLHWARVHFQEHARQGWWDSGSQGSRSLRVGRPYKTLMQLRSSAALQRRSRCDSSPERRAIRGSYLPLLGLVGLSGLPI